ncbi:Ig-like domain (group 3) [Actinopolymorpha cephalotaxi]|uniref:Ig-like domain (Group 3) n=1 Tax=Actinopolymorpha cephalotaxi TaxID=504797 RepID=A0A1I2T9B2_9ACTN|nr:ice-binding family protein [Actinopolymorpha cephalotaxi]SFG61485.1 Ig-like domain (group 3) [Actinopolymorpha cephalotaxi]
MFDSDRTVLDPGRRPRPRKNVRHGVAASLAVAIAALVVACSPNITGATNAAGAERPAPPSNTTPPTNTGPPSNPTPRAIPTPRANPTPGAGSVDLGDGASFAVFAGRSVINENTDTTVAGNLGVSPGEAVVGFPPGLVLDGDVHAGDALAASARDDFVAVYDDLSSRGPVATVPTELGGTTKGPGIYTTPGGAFTINGTLTLDGQRDPDAIFVFRATDLEAAQVSNITLVRGAQIDNVYFVLTGSATLGQWVTFQANVLAQGDVEVSAGAVTFGRLVALSESVRMNTDASSLSTHISLPNNPPTTTTLTASPNPSRPDEAVTFVATVMPVVVGPQPQGEVVFKDGATIIGSDLLNASGTATFKTSALSLGEHAITAEYLGGPSPNNEAIITLAPSTSTKVVQVVSAG